MVTGKKRQSSKAAPPSGPGLPGAITLSLVAFRNGERGFMAKGPDLADIEYFDLEMEPIETDPGDPTILRTLGEFLAGDEAGFWDLVTRA